MEKVKKAKKENRHGADFGLRILSIIIAVIIWFALSITQYPTINKTITNVPVVFSLDGTQAKEKGLSALNYKDISVDVEIKGMNCVKNADECDYLFVVSPKIETKICTK